MQLFEIREQVSRPLSEDLTVGTQANAASRAVEKAHAHRAFKLSHCPGDIRFGCAEGAGCLSETVEFGNLQEGPHAFDLIHASRVTAILF